MSKARRSFPTNKQSKAKIRGKRERRHQREFKPSQSPLHAIPTAVLMDGRISALDKLVLMVLYPLTLKEGYFFGSNELIATRLNRSTQAVQASLRRLEHKGYLVRDWGPTPLGSGRRVYVAEWLRAYWKVSANKGMEVKEFDERTQVEIFKTLAAKLQRETLEKILKTKESRLSRKELPE